MIMMEGAYYLPLNIVLLKYIYIYIYIYYFILSEYHTFTLYLKTRNIKNLSYITCQPLARLLIQVKN
ncbi:MAG: hypothetical protein MCS20_01855, partial [Candidatus Phytoplasma mali]|nr:hypothetical protein [Candidatus Phytoplasma australiense]MCG7202134.1 hypothetical protein [Candidatus Phytoplasma mali]